MSNTTKMSARARIEALVDANSFVEIGADITKRSTDFNEDVKEVPADGVITGYGVIGEDLVFVYSQDAAAMNGSIGEMHAKKIASLYHMAVKAGAPIIGLIDCAGIRIGESLDAIAGFGEIYMAKVSASGVVPQISAVLGSCGGGVAVSAGLSDITLMDADGGALFVNSPNAVLGNYKEKLDTSGADFQASAGNVDIVCASETDVFAEIRKLIGLLPANAGMPAVGESNDDLNRTISGELGFGSEAIEAVADAGTFLEIKKEFGKDMCVGLASIDGQTVGAIANTADGVLSTDGCKKAEQFIYFCDSFGLPIITFTNVSTYASEISEEKTIASGVADMTYAFASSDVPRINLIVGDAYGSAYLAMNSKHIGADLVLALETANVGVMDAALAAENLKVDKDEIENIQRGAKGAAKRGYVDSVIPVSDARKHLIYALQMFGVR
ncbi:MAG: carboxyl transferase [Eubacterium sp.]|nr:carboxyl transferase [Eubacterium sp.]